MPQPTDWLQTCPTGDWANPGSMACCNLSPDDDEYLSQSFTPATSGGFSGPTVVLLMTACSLVSFLIGKATEVARSKQNSVFVETSAISKGHYQLYTQEGGNADADL